MLLTDLQTNNVNVFPLCPGIIYQLSTPLLLNNETVSSSSDTLLIGCASDQALCILQAPPPPAGGHVEMTAATGATVSFSGILFRGPTSTPSITIHIPTNTGVAAASFVDCTWQGNGGDAIVYMDYSPTMDDTTAATVPVNRHLQQTTDNDDIVVNEAALQAALEAPTLFLSDCTWDNSIVNKAFVLATAGNVFLQDMDFDGNNVPIVDYVHVPDAPGGFVSLQGLSFRNALVTSIVVHANQTETAFVSLTDCTFVNNFGDAAVWIQQVAEDTPAARRTMDWGDNGQQQQQQRRLNDPGSTVLSTLQFANISHCTFINNTYTDAAIGSDVGYLIADSNTFSGNDVSAAIVRLQGQDAEITNSVFDNNRIRNFGAIYVGGGIQTNRTGNCGINNIPGALTCNGTFLEILDPPNCIDGTELACSPSCESLETCQVLPNSCLDTWQGLSDAIQANTVGGVFEICNGTTLQVTGSPIVIGPYATTITCKDCIIRGGTRQFDIPDGDASVVFSGITFQASSDMVVLIEVDPTFPAFLHFMDCVFRDSTGVYTVGATVLGGSTPGRALQGATTPILAELTMERCEFVVSTTRTRTIFCWTINEGRKIGLLQELQCLFACLTLVPIHVFHIHMYIYIHMYTQNNTNTDSVVSNTALQLTMTDGLFEKNTALSLIKTNAGDNSFQNIQFENNQVDAGIIHRGTNVLSYSATSLCAQGTTFSSANTCNGTYALSTDLEACRNGAVCEPTCLEYDVCPTGLQDCYSTYDSLVEAIALFPANRFELCTGASVFLPSDVNGIAVNGTTALQLSCGPDGTREGNCTIIGGNRHLHFGPDTSGSSIEGITFRGSREESITIDVHSANVPSNHTFRDCVWEGNMGEHVVSIEPLTGVPSPEAIPAGRVATGRAATGAVVTFVNCTFVSNIVTESILSSSTDVVLEGTDFHLNIAQDSVVEILAGQGTVKSTTFSDNTVTQGGQIFTGLGVNLIGDDAAEGVCTDSLINPGETCHQVGGIVGGCENGSTNNTHNTGGNGTLSSLDCVIRCEPMNLCARFNNDCVQDLPALTTAVFLSQGDETFIICPGTVFDFSATGATPLTITANNVVIRCGIDQDSFGACILQGGINHMVIQGSATNIQLLGLSFIGAIETALRATASESSSAALIGCTFVVRHAFKIVPVGLDG